MSGEWMGDPYAAQLRAAEAEGELAAIRDALREFAEETGLNPEMEPSELLAKAAGAFRSCAAMSDARYAEIQGLRAEIEAMRPRLVPEGMEWPVFEDGEPVRIGDESTFNDEAMKVEGVELTRFGYILHGSYMNGSMRCATGEECGIPAKRPAPRVLDADGVEIRVGDTVYALCDGTKHVVERIEGGNIKAEGMTYLVADKITHRAPVLAADGEPLREGETVWSVDSGTRYTVEKNTDELIPIKCRSEMGTTVSLHPSQLTHERPDSWAGLEVDAGKNPYDYCEDVGHRLDTCENSEAYKARDLVRRAKKLAGVE